MSVVELVTVTYCSLVVVILMPKKKHREKVQNTGKTRGISS